MIPTTTISSLGVQVDSLIVDTVGGPLKRLIGLQGINFNAAVRYMMVFDAVAVPANGAIPKLRFKLGIGEDRYIDLGIQRPEFALGIVIANSTTPDTLTLGAAADQHYTAYKQ